MFIQWYGTLPIVVPDTFEWLKRCWKLCVAGSNSVKRKLMGLLVTDTLLPLPGCGVPFPSDEVNVGNVVP